MIRPLFFAALLLATAATVSAQNSIPPTTSTPPSIACPAGGVPTPRNYHRWIVVSAGVMEGKKIRGENPQYPPDAKRAGVEGRVELSAMLSEAGDIEELCVIQGPAMLQQAAFDAVKTWKYRPFSLNGWPMEVKTQINVDFTLR